MATTDPISDMLTRIRNACRAKHRKVDVPSSRMKKEIARILKQERFIKNYWVVGEKPHEVIRIELRYTSGDVCAIQDLQRVSKPGLRAYVGMKRIPRILGGMGLAILSTSSGILTDKEARKQGVGGEVLCRVW